MNYIIYPLPISKFSNFKALTKHQALKFENLSDEKYHNSLVADGESIFTFLIFMSTLKFHLVLLIPN